MKKIVKNNLNFI